MGSFWQAVNALRPTICVAAIAFMLLSLPAQLLELYFIDIDTLTKEQVKYLNSHDMGT